MQVPASKILVLGTGGTIAGTASSAQDHTGYRAAQLGVGELIRSVTDVCPLAVESEQVAQVDSKDMDVFVSPPWSSPTAPTRWRRQPFFCRLF
jgi:L-asparaginase